MSDMFDHELMAWEEYEETMCGVGRHSIADFPCMDALDGKMPLPPANINPNLASGEEIKEMEKRIEARAQEKSRSQEATELGEQLHREAAAKQTPVVVRVHTGPWIHLQHSEGSTVGITGKYLFFAEDRELLLEIAEAEILENGFANAKVSREAQHKDHVMCLYWTDNSRKWELAAKYGHSETVKYRFWKSDADTLAGKYSKEYQRGDCDE